MIAILGSTFLAALIGSGHCAGMCGPFAMIAGNLSRDQASNAISAGKSWTLSVMYNLGRLLTYLIFGLVAGLLGMAIEFSGHWLGFQRAAIYFAGGTLVLFGLLGILRNFGISWGVFSTNQRFVRLLQSGIKRVAGQAPICRAFALGALTSLMPCGWLYFFVIAASSTQSVIWAPIVMLVFWLGTTPVLFLLGMTSNKLLSRLRARANWIIPIMMLGIGVYSLTLRSTVEMGNQFIGQNTDQVNQVLSTTDSSVAPCCNEHH